METQASAGSARIVESAINVWAVVTAVGVLTLAIGALGAGLIAVRRSSDNIARSIGWAATAAGTLLLLALGSAIGLDAPPPVFLPVFASVVGLFAFTFWVLTLVECATREPDQGNDKVAWVLIIALTQVVGAALYWLVRRPQRRAIVNGASWPDRDRRR